MNTLRRSPGFVLYEAMMALGLSLALVVGVTQLLALVAQQRRLASEQGIAEQEAGNLMEDFVSREWAGTQPERLSEVTLSAECRRWLPEAAVHVEAADEAPDIRRIAVEIDWRRGSGQRGAPVRLIGWQFRDAEDQR